MIHFLPYSFFQWCAKTPFARLISQSMWGFAVLETVHILGLAMLLGSIFVVNLSVLGFGMRQPAAKLARELRPWGLAGFLLMAGSGIPMFMSAALTYANSIPFVIKMTLLILAIVLQSTIHRVSGMYDGSVLGKLAACLALVCWFGVAYAGRGIAFEVLFGTGA
jgi:hypothetical protein